MVIPTALGSLVAQRTARVTGPGRDVRRQWWVAEAIVLAPGADWDQASSPQIPHEFWSGTGVERPAGTPAPAYTSQDAELQSSRGREALPRARREALASVLSQAHERAVEALCDPYELHAQRLHLAHEEVRAVGSWSEAPAGRRRLLRAELYVCTLSEMGEGQTPLSEVCASLVEEWTGTARELVTAARGVLEEPGEETHPRAPNHASEIPEEARVHRRAADGREVDSREVDDPVNPAAPPPAAPDGEAPLPGSPLGHQPRRYQVVESHCVGKHPERVCEDLVADLGHLVVVVDGVTGKDAARYGGTTGGAFAARLIVDVLASLPASVNAQYALQNVSYALHEAVVGEHGSFPPSPPGAQLAVYSPWRGEVWRVGDIHVRVGDVHLHTPAPPTDAIATAFRASVLEALLLEGASMEELRENDPTWEMILPLLKRQDVFANLAGVHPLGYGVVNGTPIPDHHVLVRPVGEAAELVMASDGYLDAEGTLAEQERTLAELLRADPLLIRAYQGFRAAPAGGSFDDRAWVRLALS